MKKTKIISIPTTKLSTPDSEADQVSSAKIKNLIAERKKAKREPLSVEKIRSIDSMQHLSTEECKSAMDTIKNLSAILYQMHCQKESISIDNQHVVSLTEQNKAA